MIFRITSILALLAFYITFVVSVPIHVHNSVVNAMPNRASYSGLEARSMSWGQSHRQDRSRLVYRDLLEYGDLRARAEPSPLVARSFDEAELEARSLDDMTASPLGKRWEDKGANDVHRRSLWSKFKSAVGKAANAVKNTASRAVSAVRNTASKAVSAVKKGVQKVAYTVKKAVHTVGKGVQKAVNTVRKGVQKAVNTVRKGVQKAANTVRKGVQKAVNTVRKGVQKVVHTVKKGVQAVKNVAHKAVKWVKQNGAKYAKIGFKAVAMATKVASHVVAVIPGVGKAAGRVLSTASKVADFVSDKIPAKLSSGMQKTMGVFEKIEHPLGTGVAGQVLDAVLKRDMEEGLSKRDLFEGDDLFERDLPILQERSFDDDFELEARWLDETPELDLRSWNLDYDEE